MIKFDDKQGPSTILNLDTDLLMDVKSNTTLVAEGTPVNPINLDPFITIKSEGKELKSIPSIPKGRTVRARLTQHKHLNHRVLYGVIKNISSGELRDAPLGSQLKFYDSPYLPIYSSSGEIFIPLNKICSHHYHKLFKVNKRASNDVFFSYSLVLEFDVKSEEGTRRYYGRIDPLVKISTGG